WEKAENRQMECGKASKELVGRTQALVLVQCSSAGYQPCVTYFIDEGAVAYLECLSRFSSVPLVGAQRFENYLFFHFLNHVFCDALQCSLLRAVRPCDFKIRLFLNRRILVHRRFRPEQHVSSDTIREFSYVPRPPQAL